jgi:Glutamine phosphoribosylpyrophosphate amidotransferase
MLMVDDYIMGGTISELIIKLMRYAEATEVHSGCRDTLR